jgi:hypothetical protein
LGAGETVVSDVWSFIAVSFFWCWVAAFLFFIFKAFPQIGVFKSRQAMIWGGISALSACFWILALRNA